MVIFIFFLQIVGKCAMDYGRMVLESLKKKGFYDDIGQFDVTDEVSLVDPLFSTFTDGGFTVIAQHSRIYLKEIFLKTDNCILL